MTKILGRDASRSWSARGRKSLALTESNLSKSRLFDRNAWIVGLGTTAALAGQSAGPWVLTAYTSDRILDAQLASLVVAIELFATGLSMLAIAPFVGRLLAKPVTILSLIFLVAAQIGTAFVSNVIWLLFAMRILAGVSSGLLFSIANARGAGDPSPDRTYAFAGATTLILGTAINPTLAFSLTSYGASGMFLALAAFCACLALPLSLIRFPKAQLPQDVLTVSAPLSFASISGVMVLMGLLAFATNGVFVFVPTIAAGLGLHGGSLGSAMSLVSLLSSLGAIAAGRLGTRFGRTSPIVIGLLVMGTTLFWLTVADNRLAFWTAFTLLVLTYWFLYPYMLGLSVEIDRQGRVAAATGSAKILAGALGSAVAGTVATLYGIVGYGVVALVSCVAAAMLAVAFAAFRRRGSPSVPVAAPV